MRMSDWSSDVCSSDLSVESDGVVACCRFRSAFQRYAVAIDPAEANPRAVQKPIQGLNWSAIAADGRGRQTGQDAAVHRHLNCGLVPERGDCTGQGLCGYLEVANLPYLLFIINPRSS